MRKITVLFALTLTLLSVSAFAAEPQLQVLYNGRPMTFADATAEIIDGRVMLPFRAVFERLNAEVNYDDESRTVTADLGGRKLSFSLDGAEIYADGSDEPVYVMDVPPVLKDGRTLIPLRAAAEAGGLDVGWDEENRTVILIDKVGVSAEIAEGCPALEDLRTLLDSAVNVYSHNETTRITTPSYSLCATVRVDADGQARRAYGELTANVGDRSETGSIEFIAARDAFYFKTDIFQKLAGAIPAAYSENIPAERWMMADWGELEEYISGADSGALGGAAALLIDGGGEKEELESLVNSVTDGIDVNSAESALNLAANIDAVKAVFGADKLGVSKRPDGSAELWLTVHAADLAALTGEEGAELTYGATYYGGAEITSRVALDLPGKASFQSETSGGQPLFSEKIELPPESDNFVDILHTIARAMASE